MSRRCLATSCLLVCFVVAGTETAAQTFVKTHEGMDGTRTSVDPRGEISWESARSDDQAALACGLTASAWYGQPVAGGTLHLVSFNDPPALNAAGRLAFFSTLDGVARNQGIFVYNAGSVTPIVLGCGGPGGSGNPGTACGDPSPVGGTFTGFFGGTSFAPAMNEAGDVLFVADVVNGSATRGLFLYRASSGQIQKVAAVGDPSPLGGTFGAVGPGSINNARQVVFLASRPGDIMSDIFRWENGVTTKVAAVGDVAPGGGSFWALGAESWGFPDGTNIPGGPVPDINETGQIAFRGYVNGGLAAGGLFLSVGGAPQWYVRTGDPTPAGGTYIDFFAPILNDRGAIAFFGDFDLGGGNYSSGWFVGKPGAWRKALAFYDPLDFSQVYGMAVSRNPMAPLDDDGNLVLWADVYPKGGRERLLVSEADGRLTILARQGDPGPSGGSIGTFLAWPSMSPCAATASAGLPGSALVNAHLLVPRRPMQVGALRVNRGGLPGAISISSTGTDGVFCPSTTFDVLRGDLTALRHGYPGGAVCAADSVSALPYLEASGECPSPAGCWYLVRAQNGCFVGSYGAPDIDAASPCP